MYLYIDNEFYALRPQAFGKACHLDIPSRMLNDRAKTCWAL